MAHQYTAERAGIPDSAFREREGIHWKDVGGDNAAVGMALFSAGV